MNQNPIIPLILACINQGRPLLKGGAEVAYHCFNGAPTIACPAAVVHASAKVRRRPNMRPTKLKFIAEYQVMSPNCRVCIAGKAVKEDGWVGPRSW